MIQGIQSNTYSITNSIVTDNVKKISETNVEQETVKSQISKTDSVEISSEGRLATEISSIEGENAVQSTDSAVASAKPAGQPPSTSTISVESTESTETTTVLTNLTEAQLDDLVEEGTITQAEKNTELARRASLELDKTSEEKQEVDNDSKTKTNVNLLNDDEEF